MCIPESVLPGTAAIVLTRLKYLEIETVIPIQPIARRQPDEAILVLQDTVDAIVRQASLVR